MNTITRTSATERVDYEVARAALMQTKGLQQQTVADALLTQSFLRTIIPLSATLTNYTLQVLNNQNNSGVNIRPDEQRLQQQDAFYMNRIMFYIAKASSATDTGYSVDTYNNAITFPTGAAGLNQLYNGKFLININNNVVVPAYPMLEFKQIPLTQLTGAANPPADAFDGSQLVPIAPSVVFVGTYNSFIQVFLPAATGTLDANTLLICEIEGVLAQNVALGAPGVNS